MRKIALAVLIFSITSSTSAQNLSYFSQKVDSLLQANNPIPFSGEILIQKGHQEIYYKQSGVYNHETRELLSKNSLFEIMSNTKLFTTVLIMKEVERGTLHLDDYIGKYLPEITQPWANSVTIHQLLNHTHGIDKIDQPLLFPSGTQFKYGNLSNILLGKILEKINKKTYRTLINSLISSLGLKTTYLYKTDNNPNLAFGGKEQKGIFTNTINSFINEENLPADGMISNSRDLAKWNNALHQGKILKGKNYQLIIKPSAKSQHYVFGLHETGYGYNIRVNEENGIKYYGHTGLGDGFSSMNLYFPKQKTSLIVLQNIMPEDNEKYYFYETKIKEFYLKSFEK